MNAENVASPTCPDTKSSSNSSPDSTSSPMTNTKPSPEEFSTAPLTELVGTTMDNLSLQQLREKVVEIRNQRLAQHVFTRPKAETKSTEPVEPKASKLASLDEFC